MTVKPVRLDRFLTEMTSLSRTQAREAAKRGRILVNGVPVRRTEEKILPGTDRVSVDGEEFLYTAQEYYMLNKPAGVVSATEDERYPTVLDLIGEKKRKDLFPVGRLDLDTEGLLLITNDGAMAHRLLSPRRHVDKVYLIRYEGTLPADAAERFERGIVLEDGTETLPAVLEFLEGDEAGGQARLTIREGKFHQVKRMMEAVGCRVVYLKRLSMGSLVLDENLKPGQYRPLTKQELEDLRQI